MRRRLKFILFLIHGFLSFKNVFHSFQDYSELKFYIRKSFLDAFIPRVRATVSGSIPAPPNWIRAAPGPGWPHSGQGSHWEVVWPGRRKKEPLGTSSPSGMNWESWSQDRGEDSRESVCWRGQHLSCRGVGTRRTFRYLPAPESSTVLLTTKNSSSCAPAEW